MTSNDGGATVSREAKVSTRPLPVVHPENQTLYEYLRKGELRLQQCRQCGKCRYPVSPICPACLADEAEWVPVSGRGRLVTAVRVERATGDQWWSTQVPFSVGLVALDEGPQLKAAVSRSDAPFLHPGDQVRLEPEDVGGVILLRLVPDQRD